MVDVSMPHRSVHPSFRESIFGRSLRNESRLETDVAMAERKRREASLPVMVAGRLGNVAAESGGAAER